MTLSEKFGKDTQIDRYTAVFIELLPQLKIQLNQMLSRSSGASEKKSTLFDVDVWKVDDEGEEN